MFVHTQQWSRLNLNGNELTSTGLRHLINIFVHSPTMMHIRTFQLEVSHNALDINAGEPLKHLLNVLSDAHQIELDFSGNRLGNHGITDNRSCVFVKWYTGPETCLILEYVNGDRLSSIWAPMVSHTTQVMHLADCCGKIVYQNVKDYIINCIRKIELMLMICCFRTIDWPIWVWRN